MSPTPATMTPPERIRGVNGPPVRRDGRYVLYWMTAQRRLHANFALQRAVEVARELRRPLVILEALRIDYPWASDRLHSFVVDGMAQHARTLVDAPVHYYPYVEPFPGAGRGLVDALAADACGVITDDYPAFFIPPMLAALGSRLDVRLEAVDGNGLRPMRRGDRVFPTAYSFRRALQMELPDLLDTFPLPDPLLDAGLLPLPRGLLSTIQTRWAPAVGLEGFDLASLPIDHSVAVAPVEGGRGAALARLGQFMDGSVERYGEGRNQPDEDVTSGLSPYLHFGHLGAHEVAGAVLAAAGWTPERLAMRATGTRTGWWGLPAAAEAFLDQLVTWRELGFNAAAHDPAGIGQFESLPDWAQDTLERHAADPREHVYTLDELARADTHDPLWNAAQRQLLRDGRMHNYLRMLWGKKILEWTVSPREALSIMLELNNRFALDGRDPNSTTGIAWVLGRYDRAWGPERPVYGTVRYMSSANTARKLRMTEYLRRYGPSE